MSWRQPGFRARTIEQVVDRVLTSSEGRGVLGDGVTQQKHGVATVREIVNFLMLRGNLGRPGRVSARSAGTATSRATARWASGRRCRSRSSMRWSESSASLPPKHGLDAVDSIRAMRDGRAKLFVGFAGNFVARPRTAS